MATITGVYLAAAALVPAARREALRRFAQLFVASRPEQGGPSAVALLHLDGTSVVAAAPLPPSSFSGTPAFRNVLARADETAVAVLGSAGVAFPGLSLPPLRLGPEDRTTVAWYAGRIHNGPALAADLGLPAERGTDRDLVTHLVNTALERPAGGREAHEISARLRLLEGSFALAAWDARFPDSLLVGRFRHGLYLFGDPASGAVFLTSRGGLLPPQFLSPAIRFAAPDNAVWFYSTGPTPSGEAKIFPEEHRKAAGRTLGRGSVSSRESLAGYVV